MNLIDDLGSDLAMAFLVEKKYSGKLDARESLALIGDITEALSRPAPETDNRENKICPPATGTAARGN